MISLTLLQIRAALFLFLKAQKDDKNANDRNTKGSCGVVEGEAFL